MPGNMSDCSMCRNTGYRCRNTRYRWVGAKERTRLDYCICANGIRKRAEVPSIVPEPHVDQFGSSHTVAPPLTSEELEFVDTNDVEWIIHEEPPSFSQSGYSDTSQPSLFSTLEVECKVCNRKIPYEINRIGIDFFLSPTDLIGVCTCASCFQKKKYRNLPKDIVCVYHNRRKLRTRRRK